MDVNGMVVYFTVKNKNLTFAHGMFASIGTAQEYIVEQGWNESDCTIDPVCMLGLKKKV